MKWAAAPARDGARAALIASSMRWRESAGIGRS
jgi:hypothetical protein